MRLVPRRAPRGPPSAVASSRRVGAMWARIYTEMAAAPGGTRSAALGLTCRNVTMRHHPDPSGKSLT